MRFLKFKIMNRLFMFSEKKVYPTMGLNSNLTKGGHLLCFDFDEAELLRVWYELKKVQKKYNLPRIYILSSGKKDHYHGYCMKRVDLRTAVKINLDCPSVDHRFICFGLWRNHFTIRVSAKNGRDVRGIMTIDSPFDEDVHYDELDSFTKYDTTTG